MDTIGQTLMRDNPALSHRGPLDNSFLLPHSLSSHLVPLYLLVQREQ